MDEKRLVELMKDTVESNNEKLVQMMDNKIQANNEKLVQMMDDKIQANNEKLVQIMDDKIQTNNYKIIEYFEKRFKQLEEKIIDNSFYFEEHYGKKIDIIFEKLQFNDQIKSKEDEQLQKYKKQNDTLLISHEVRITNLEKVVNAN